MRNCFWLALVWLGSALHAPAFAQTSAWQLLRGNSGTPFVRVAGSGNIATLSLSCSQGKPLMLVALRRTPARSPARLAVTVGSQSVQISIQRTANAVIWGTVLPDGRLPDLIASGQRADLAIDGAAFGSVSLAGASAAMREALTGCWAGAMIAPKALPTPQGAGSSKSAILGDPKRLSPADRSAIMRAAGYTLRGKSWLTCEGMATGEIEELRDLNGDSKPEAIVKSGGTACYGNTGAAFQIVTSGSAGWRLMVEETGIPSFHPRAGLAWPDIEIGGPGISCFRFLRWNGQAYVSAGTSLDGQICTLSPAFATEQASRAKSGGHASSQTTSNSADEEAIRALLGKIYGWRDGRKVADARGEDWRTLFSPRIRGLLDQCEAAVANADPKANGGEGAYAVTGDQGCLGVPFLLDPVTFEPAPFIQRTRPAVRRAAPDAIESTIIVPAAARSEWGSSETIRFQRIGGRWLVDEVVTLRAQRTLLYSSGIVGATAELRKIARKPVPRRKR